MIFLVSKKNDWSNHLFSSIKEEHECKYFNDGSYVEALINFARPDWIFFFHWSNLIPAEVYKNHRCVVIHTGNLPQGRGGSPIQNQILDGIVESRVNAIAVERKIDSGGVYCSLPITLQGNLYDIWMTIANLARLLIKRCVDESPLLKSQEGSIQTYKRRKENQIPFSEMQNLNQVYKFIQMLDADGYPNPYLKIDGFKIEFSRAKMSDGDVLCDVKIRRTG
jgi:methionyl-tRNA formyltransferase